MIKLVSESFFPIENICIDFSTYYVFCAIDSIMYNDFKINFLYSRFNREDIFEIVSTYKNLKFQYTSSSFYETMKELISFGTYDISVNDKYIYDKLNAMSLLL